METQATKMTVSQQLTAINIKQTQISAMQIELTDKSSHVKLQDATEGTVSDDLRLVAEACDCPAKHAEMTRQCRNYSATTTTAAFLALLAKRGDLKNCCETLTLGKQCIFR